ncbi:MAG: hypothetical protein L0Z48_03650 [candidate division Zixibacteria bacterium]|nr:hypothetical protein [candidate division Zixibacteria bacterium]MCI0595621.1 hypothetical protein [candidate division Zixibacteria bacterium]
MKVNAGRKKIKRIITINGSQGFSLGYVLIGSRGFSLGDAPDTKVSATMVSATIVSATILPPIIMFLEMGAAFLYIGLFWQRF